MLNKQKIRTTAGRGRLFESVLDTIGDTPCIRVNNLAPKGVRRSTSRRRPSIRPRRSRTGSPSTSSRRPSATARSSPARPWSRRPAATPASASPWSAPRRAIRWSSPWPTAFPIERRKLMRMLGAKVVLTPRAAKRLRHVPEGGGAGRRPMAGSWPTSSRRRPMPPSTRRQRHARSSMISPAHGSTASSPATAPVAPSSAWPACCVVERPETKHRAVRAGQRAVRSAAARRSSAVTVAPLPPVIRPSSRIPSRAGRRTSSRNVLQEAIDKPALS